MEIPLSINYSIISTYIYQHYPITFKLHLLVDLFIIITIIMYFYIYMVMLTSFY